MCVILLYAPLMAAWATVAGYARHTVHRARIAVMAVAIPTVASVAFVGMVVIDGHVKVPAVLRAVAIAVAVAGYLTSSVVAVWWAHTAAVVRPRGFPIEPIRPSAGQV